MTPQELNWIRQKQREFFTLFNKKLEVDLASMQGLKAGRKTYFNASKLEEGYQRILLKNNASREKIESRKNHVNHSTMVNEKAALIEFAHWVYDNNIHITAAASLIKRDRSILYEYISRYKSDYNNTN